MAKFRPERGRLAAIPAMATPRRIRRNAARIRRRVPYSSVGPPPRRRDWAGVTAHQARRARLKSILGPRLTVLARCMTRGLSIPRWGNLRRVEPFSTSFGFDRGKPVDRYYLDRFLDANRALITGRVLEVQVPSYTKRFGENLIESHTVDVNPAFHTTY